MVRILLSAVAISLTLVVVYPASARMTYTYINSGHCPGDLRHVRNVARACGFHRPAQTNKLMVNNSRWF
jgi:hypothetical protein